jgi:hypothetical protein
VAPSGPRDPFGAARAPSGQRRAIPPNYRRQSRNRPMPTAWVALVR